ncbi:TetR/AcrR family transcriptional regulator [Stappia sp.]|uniref:TetR/AcrR family transcriptional regulator n=1 Tax=Stappia sp. TaxID=1870903 RepID=UPI003C79F806
MSNPKGNGPRAEKGAAGPGRSRAKPAAAAQTAAARRRPDPAAPKPKTARGEATRRAILSAAEKVIGEQGFNEASIGSITREAGVAQGTFYIYFASKDDVFSELVADMGRMLRHAISEATAGIANRLDAEREGLRAFLTFVSAHPELYRIVQEAQFVDPKAYLAYFRTFAEGYRDGLAQAADTGDIRAGDADIRAWALMGIARSLGEYSVVFGSDASIDEMVDTAHEMIVHGLAAGAAGGDGSAGDA